MDSRLVDVIAQYAPRERIRPEAPLLDLVEDELDTIELLMTVEEELGLEIPDYVAEGIRTVGDLARYVEGAFSKGSAVIDGGGADTDGVTPSARLRALVRKRLAEDLEIGGNIFDHADLADDLGVPEIGVGLFVVGFLRNRFGVEVDASDANKVFTVKDLENLAAGVYEPSGIECVCAATFFRGRGEVSVVECNKECPRKATLAALGAFGNGS